MIQTKLNWTWSDWFTVDFVKGELYAKVRRGDKIQVGTRVGGKNGNGYRMVQCNYQRIPEHRIIWEMANGPIPEGMQIDHIDRNPLNNSLNNLRLANRGENKINQCPR